MAITPLATTQRVLTWLSELPSDKSISIWKRIAYFVLALTVFASNVLGVIAGAFFISKFISTRLEEVLYALLHVICSSNATYQSIMIVILRYKFRAIFVNLENIYKQSE